MNYLKYTWYGFNASAGNIDISITFYNFIENTVTNCVMFSVVFWFSMDIKQSFSGELSHQIFMFIIWGISNALSVIVLILSLIINWPQFYNMDIRDISLFAVVLCSTNIPVIVHTITNGIRHFLWIYHGVSS